MNTADAAAHHRGCAREPHTSTAATAAIDGRRESKSVSRLWIWVLIAFVIQIAVWTGWLVFAGKHPVAEVPLAADTPQRQPARH